MKIRITSLYILLLFANFRPLNAQLISIDIDSGEAMEAIKIIKAQYPMGYSIDPELLKGAKKVTIYLKNASLQDVLEAICKNQLFYFVFENRMLYSKRRESGGPQPVLKTKVPQNCQKNHSRL